MDWGGAGLWFKGTPTLKNLFLLENWAEHKGGGLYFEDSEMVFRPEDHQALQSMFAFKIRAEKDVPWGIPQLTKVLTWKDMDIPIRNKK